MLAFFLHFIALAVAGTALFVLWRKTITADRWTNLAIAAGFTVRAVVGQVLFWVSWARLPFASSLQLGRGFWFFAVDAFTQYYPEAVQGAHGGIPAILHFPRGMASVSFVQFLSAGMLLFGEAPSTALLLNLFFFLASSYLIIRWADGHSRARVATRAAIIAIALSPALILWSLQPLKDTFFLFLVVSTVAACAAWERSWNSQSSLWRRISLAAAIWMATYLIAGIRWYFALTMFVGLSVFAFLVAVRGTSRKAVAIGSWLLFTFALSRAFLFGSGPYVPTSISGPLTFSRADAASGSFSLVDSVESVRSGFTRSGGATQIVTPGDLEAMNRAAAAGQNGVPRAASAADATQNPAAGLKDRTEAATTPAPLATATTSSPAREVTPARRRQSARNHSSTEVPSAAANKPMTTEPGRSENSATTIPTAAVPTPTVIPTSSVDRSTTTRGRGRRHAVEREKRDEHWLKLRAQRLAAGVAAIVLPRSLGQRTGLYEMGGGKNFSWFSDIDTLVFDSVLVFAFLWLVRSARTASLSSSTFWFVAGVTILLSLPLAYAVTNFGTLFRLREIIYIGLLLMPLALATAEPKLTVPAEHLTVEPDLAIK